MEYPEHIAENKLREAISEHVENLKSVIETQAKLIVALEKTVKRLEQALKGPHAQRRFNHG